MKHLVLIFFIFLTFLGSNCSKEKKTVSDIPESELVEAYVQIALIYESERGLAEKDARVANYLTENNLSKQKIDRMLDKYKSNPSEWRGFFMKVQSRLRELEAQQRMKTDDDEFIKGVVTEEQISIVTDLAAIVDTVIVGSVEIDSDDKEMVEGSFEHDSSKQFIALTVALPDDDVTKDVAAATPSTDKDRKVIQNFVKQEEIKTEEGLGFIYYKIKMGDNLSTLAKEHNSETSQLMLVNSLENANSIKIGQTLLIPNNFTMVLLHTISSGEALSKISSRYNSNLDLLIKINKIDDVNSIKSGDFLYIPVLKGE